MSTETLAAEFEALAPEQSEQPEQPVTARLIGFALTFEQMSTLLAVLGCAPYRDVAGLVETIRQQADAEFQRQSLLVQFSAMPPDLMGRA